ncbi:hypothetical protein Tco_1257062 [Tanacetum coccineum]
METIHITFDEMHQSMAPVRMSSGPEPFIMTPGLLMSSGPGSCTNVHLCLQRLLQMHRHHPVQHQEIAEEPTHEDTPINHDVLHLGDPCSAQSSSGNVNSAEPIQVNYPPDHLRRCWQSLSSCIYQKTVSIRCFVVLFPY